MSTVNLNSTFFRTLVKRILAIPVERGAFWENARATSFEEFEALRETTLYPADLGSKVGLNAPYDPTEECMFFLFIAEMLESEGN